MPTIKIHRRRDWTFILGYSSLSEILLDGQKIGFVSGGETNVLDVSPGQHKLKVKMGRYGSKDLVFTLFNKETKTFTVSSMKSYITVAAILFGILAEFNHRILKINFNRNTIYIITAVIILIIVGLHVFGRNRYLSIKEDKERSNI